jgi:hypothetical protein
MQDLFSDLTSVLNALAGIDGHDLPEPAALVHTEAVLDAQHRMSAITARALQSCDAPVPQGGRPADVGRSPTARAPRHCGRARCSGDQP